MRLWHADAPSMIFVHSYSVMAPLYSDDLLPYFVGIHIAELAGLIALLKY